MQDLRCGLRVFIIAFHDAGTLDGQLADRARGDVLPLLVDDARLPEIPGLADGADLFDVVHAQMDAARANGLGQAVVRVVFVVREIFEPALDKARRHGLRADVHEPPLVEQVVVKIDAAGLDRVENVLRPGHEQPDDRAFFLRDGPQDPFRLHAPQQNGLAARDQTAEPVHLRARVVERRDAEENVVFGLAVVMLLGHAGTDERLVPVQDRLREAGRAGGEVDGGVIVLTESDGRDAGGTEAHEPAAVLRVARHVPADEQADLHAGQALLNRIETADEFRPEDQDLHVGQIQTVRDFVRSVAEVERHRDAPGLEDAKINGQPLQTVHQQNADLRAAFHAAAEQEVCEPVGPAVKIAPGELPPVRRVGLRLGDEARFAPGDSAVTLLRGVDLDERSVGTIESCVPLEKIRNDHFHAPFLQRNKKNARCTSQSAEDEKFPWYHLYLPLARPHRALTCPLRVIGRTRLRLLAPRAFGKLLGKVFRPDVCTALHRPAALWTGASGRT